jgi:hypothetical protein
MDLRAMLEKCRREQWTLDDLDWSGTPREMSADDEIAIVQYFTDMAGIERLAEALFAEQARRAEDPVLREVFESFVLDEARHATVAERLARFYDVHHHRRYVMNESLTKFRPHFVAAVRQMSPEIANGYITAGEVVLDVALLRSINDHVRDEMSQRAMDLVNRDESRHIAVDFHMVEYYGSRAYQERLEREPPPSLAHRVRATWAMANVLWYAAPFFRQVFFEPMARVDPSGRRLRDAMKRIQLVTVKPTFRRSRFVKVMVALQDAYNDRPVVRRFFGRAIERVVGLRADLLERLYSEDERGRAEAMTFAQLADEALAAKFA